MSLPFHPFSRFFLRSLRGRLALTFTMLVATLLVAADAGLVGYAHYSASRQADHALDRGLEVVRFALANEVSEVSDTAGGQVPKNNGTKGITSLSPASSPPAAEVVREMELALAQEGVVVLIADDKGNTWRSAGAASLDISEKARGGWRIRSSRVPSSNSMVEGGFYTIVVGIRWQQTEEGLLEQAALLSALTLFMILVAGVGAFLLVGRTLQPIARLAEQARTQAAQTSLPNGSNLQLTPPSPDAEVVNLVTTLNTLLGTLAETTAMKSRFYIAASHELRSPLQVLSGRAEITLSLPRSREEYQAALTEVQEQANHLIALVQSLLLLNRLERTTVSETQYEACPLAAVCQEQKNLVETQANARHLHLVVDPSAEYMPLISAVSAVHGEIMVRNLLENAVRYTPMGGTIRVMARLRSASSLAFEIVNTATPIPTADAARLMEPFYRPDPSRNNQTGGSGLGLSICRALAEVNEWGFSLHQDEDGFHASVVFPIYSYEESG